MTMSGDRTGGTGAGENGFVALTNHFEELQALLVSAHGGPPDPERVVGFASAAVPHADDCGLTLVPGRGRPTTVAASRDTIRQVDTLQYRLGQGPCLTASTTGGVVRADDLRTDRQWPAFAAACVAETPVRSMFSIRLVLTGQDTAAINFYAEQPRVFDETDIGIGAIFGPFAALSLQTALNASEANHLHTALLSSRQIGTAIGILMARELITSEQAFARLVSASQHLNRKLKDVAAEVEETGRLPERRRP
jgi:hypothetical protein